MERSDRGRAVVTVTVAARVGSRPVQGQSKSVTVYHATQPEVWRLVDAALDLTPDRLWDLVQYGAPLADTPENRQAVWEVFCAARPVPAP